MCLFKSIIDEIYHTYKAQVHDQKATLIDFDSNLHRTRYNALLWNYDNHEVMTGVVIHNEDPPKKMRPFVDLDSFEKVNMY